ncbi:MAG: choice-of-anchor J domain-containing protein [Dinghuibacter sp.]|nr:choice-of-anchor J domain-containing protein [Dinghuibacter sp.]
MKKNNILIYVMVMLVTGTITLFSCKKDTPPPTEEIAPAAPSLDLVEDFDTVQAMTNRGWVLLNSSEPIGGRGWGQGKYTFGGKFGGSVIGFPAHAAHNLPTDYAACDLTAVNMLGGINAWMISPVLTIKNGDKITFYSRSGGAVPDRMQVRANLEDESVNVGAGVNGVGKFTTLWLDINPSLSGTGYPTTWTLYTINVSGVTGVKKGRIAFRYFIPDNAGDSGANADVIGVDSFVFDSN